MKKNSQINKKWLFKKSIIFIEKFNDKIFKTKNSCKNYNYQMKPKN